MLTAKPVTPLEQHEPDCDCDTCCLGCQQVPRKWTELNDGGLCAWCAIECASFAGMARMDSAKVGA